jgi:ubiquinone biosynthesis protein COQ4
MLRVSKCCAALKALILMFVSEEQRISQAMRFFFITEGQAFERTFLAFRATLAGRKLLRLQPDLSDIYASRDLQQACPPGSLGHCYAAFMKDFGLSEAPYLQVAIQQSAHLAHDPERAWFHLRFDSSHDIRHVLTGYGPDRLGEICLLCFRYGQIRHPGMALFIFFGLLSLIFSHRGSVLAALWEAYWRGRRAVLLDLLPWEEGFAEQLALHRATLGLRPPQFYPNSFASEAYLKGNMQAMYGERHKSENTNRALETI